MVESEGLLEAKAEVVKGPEEFSDGPEVNSVGSTFSNYDWKREHGEVSEMHVSGVVYELVWMGDLGY